MDGGVASVDTLVYQLEDDDASVRWATLQRLRKRAAVERAQLPVRNPRRFLQCLRRRLGDEDPRIARETLLLLRDLVDVLGDDVELLLSSVLPHLVARLARHGSDDDNEEYSSDSRLDSDAFSVFRKYVTVTNDLAAVANLLVNMGLAHAHAHVREAALLSLIRLLDERYGGRRLGDAGKKKSAARVDATLFTELVQAAAPALEDDDENVVVAAEEVIAKIQLFWGHVGFQEVMPYLSSQDKATLHAHEDTISAFVEAAAQGAGASPSVSASQVLALRASLPASVGASAFAAPVTTLRFGFIANEVVDALQGNRGNSNAEWKKRTAAVEQLYAATKQVDARVLRHAASADTGDAAEGSIGSLLELVEILLRLLQDIDVHLVKRSLQIQRLLFAKLEPDEDNDGSERPCDPSKYVQRVLPALVETSANYAEDTEITAHAYALFQTLFSASTASVMQLTRALLGSLSHRRIQVREEALKIWMVLLLTAPSTKGAINESVVHALGKVLGDGSARVRHMATELAAVMGHATRHDLCAILEAHVDDYTLERIDLDALYVRLRDKRLPALLENGQLRLLEPVGAPKATNNGGGGLKAAATRSPVRTSSQRPAGVESGELLDGPSELLQLDRSAHKEFRLSSSTTRRDPDPTRTSERDYSRNDWRKSESADPTRASAAGAVPRDVSSAPGEPVVDKLQALKRKTELLRKSASSKQVTNRQFNPQEGEFEFAAAGYAAQQQPPPQQQRSKGLGHARSAPQNDVEEDAVDLDEVSRHRPTAPGRTVRTPRNDNDSDRNLRKPTTVTPMMHPAKRYEETHPAIPGDDRPIRPMRAVDLDALIPAEETDMGGRVETKTRAPAAMSLATKKRLEARQRQEQQAASGDDDETATDDAYADHYPSEPSPDAPKPRTLSLATRKRQEQSRANDPTGGGTSSSESANAKPPKRGSLGGAPPPVSGKQEPRYLEPHELLPLKDAKQDAAKVAAQLRADDWEVVFEALNTVRRLAAHHAKLLEDKVHGVVTEILKQVPNLRSSVAKNALLALDSLHVALGRQLDGEVDNVVPVLMKRCTDASAFVCESTSQSIHTVIAHCSTARVVNAVAAHLSSRAIAIRREVARTIHAVIVGLADQAPTAKEFPTILSVVAKCLEDSNNEVRDVAKRSVLYLHQELRMDGDKIKKLLPASVHGKIEPLLTRAPILGRQREPAAASMSTAAAAKQGEKSSQAVPARRGSTTTTTSGLDNDALAALAAKLDSGNWKDRFDALGELAPFVARHGTRLCESGKLLTLFDGLLKRMEDGNAKVATLALELLPAMIASLGDGMEIVLQTFVPVLAKALAASNAKQAALAGASLRALCTHVDARALCPHLAAVARNANSRVKPTLVDALVELAATRDEKLQPALSRYVLPLALELLKEGKSDVKDVTARLLRALHGALGGATVAHAASKLSTAQQDKLAAILGVRNL